MPPERSELVNTRKTFYFLLLFPSSLNTFYFYSLFPLSLNRRQKFNIQFAYHLLSICLRYVKQNLNIVKENINN